MEWPWALEERAESQIMPRFLRAGRRIEPVTEIEKSNGEAAFSGKLCSLGHSVGWAAEHVQTVQ